MNFQEPRLLNGERLFRLNEMFLASFSELLLHLIISIFIPKPFLNSEGKAVIMDFLTAHVSLLYLALSRFLLD